MASAEQQIYDYLTTDLGFSPAGAAGALGNLQVESGFSPTAWNAREGALGIGQWELGRYTALQSYAAAHGGKPTDLSIQLGYMGSELKRRAGVLAAGRSATDPAAFAAIWDAQYEGSSGTTRAQRVGNATSIYQQIKSGKPLTKGNGASGGTKIGGQLVGNPLTDLADGIASNGTVQTLANAAADGYDDITHPFAWVTPLVYKAAFAVGGLALIVLGGAAAARKAA